MGQPRHYDGTMFQPLWAALAAAGAVAACTSAPLQTPPPPGEWVVPGGDLANSRHSALAQITPANVGRLTLAWQYETGAARGQEGAPLVQDGVMIFHTPFPNEVQAVRLADRRRLWTYRPQQDAGVVPLMCCDVVSRGLAQGFGRVFLQQADGTLVALDRNDGHVVWQAANSDARLGATATNAPQVFDHYVVTGVAGGEYGVRGHLSAYDAHTGRLAWRGWSVGSDADLILDPQHSMTWRDGRLQPVGPDSSLASWTGPAWQTGGGTTWGWTAYDPRLRLVYYGSGNPGPWNPVQRPGDNRWTNALWARDIDTGRVRWVYQMTPHDEWDYDGVNEPLLFDGPELPGHPRPLLAHFDRNGFAYVLDRATGELLSAEKFDPSVNWATHVDRTSGRPVVDPAHSPQHQGEDITTRGVCPPAIGAKNQAPAAYDGALRRFFVPTNHLCMDIEPFHIDYTAGQPFVGASVEMHPVPGDESARGAVVGWDADTGRAAWRHAEAEPVWSGVLSTASGLVFYGTLDGHLKALDARTGQLLWASPPLPSGVVGNVVTWRDRGRQFVGVLTGIGGLAADPDGLGRMRTGGSPAAATPSRGAFVAFALPEAGSQ